MKYEIAYLSDASNTAALAKVIASMLPEEDTRLIDLSLEDASGMADIYFIGFGMNSGAVPLKIMEALDCAEGKTVSFFVTSGMEPTESYKDSIERKMLPFVPDDCEYKGLFLCASQFSDAVANKVQETLRLDPENAQAKVLLENYKKTYGHPNGKDVEALQDFIWDVLNY